MSLFEKILGALAIVTLVGVSIFLRRRFRNFMQRRTLGRIRHKADKLISSNKTFSEEKYDALINKLLKLYESSVYIQKEDQIRIQELNHIRKEQKTVGLKA